MLHITAPDTLGQRGELCKTLKVLFDLCCKNNIASVWSHEAEITIASK